MLKKIRKIGYALFLLGAVLAVPVVTSAADTVERETVRFNDAVTKLKITHDQTLESLKNKLLGTLSTTAKNRTRSNDAEGAMAAWRAVLSLDREHVDACAFFTKAGTLEQVLKELDTKPTDLLGLEAGK